MASPSAQPSRHRSVASATPQRTFERDPAAGADPPPSPTPFEPVTVATGEFAGTDDFHFGSGTASIIEVEPGRYHLRLEDFSVRNGPDLYVYLSPAADGYTDDALEVGLLKATDGSFGYDLPAGARPGRFRSAIIWCKQFSHLFATAPFVSLMIGTKVRAVQARPLAVPSRWQTPRKRPWPERSSTQLGLLSRLTREPDGIAPATERSFVFVYSDKNLTCADCGQEFVFTASEQDFYAQRGFTEPRRCALVPRQP